GLIVCRTDLPPGKSLRDAVEAHVRHEARRLSGHTVLDEQETLWSGAPAIEVRVRWRHEGAAYYERQAHVVAGGAWMLLGMTGPLADRAACDERMDRIRDTLRLRDPE